MRKEVKMTAHVIAYDITNKTRLKKVAKCCELYGGRKEKSVFELHLDERIFAQFWKEMQSLIDPQHDTVIVYPLCEFCKSKIITLGKTSVENPPTFLFF